MINTTQYRTHPAAEMFPRFEANDLRELAEDIKLNGLREPITMCEGKVLDGRNRLMACERAAVVPAFVELPPGESPVAFVWSKNYTRRHLNTSQRAAAAMMMSELLSKEAKQRMSRGGSLAVRQGVEIIPPPEIGRTRDKLAEMAHVSNRSISDAQMISREAPELVNDIRAGTLTISGAKKRIRNAKQADKVETGGGEIPDMADGPVIYQAMLAVVEVVIGADDLARRDEILRGIHDAIKAQQSPAHPWLTIVRERYAQGVLQSHSSAGLDPLPLNWESLEPVTRIASCLVTSAKVAPIAAPGFQAKHDTWQGEIRRAVEGVGGGKSDGGGSVHMEPRYLLESSP